MNGTASAVLDARTLPDSDARRRYEALVGIDEVQHELLRALRVVMNPEALRQWAREAHLSSEALRLVLERPQLFVLGGDVGTGKTELAETIGDTLARAEHMEITLFSLSLAARGTGFVGEMTQRIVTAFETVRDWGEKRKSHRGNRRCGAILFIDEADAIAQSRESAQMHHEDRAGVNALIRGIDDLTRANGPVAVLMATNRLEDLDPGVRRRAANVFAFGRPRDSQRRALFARLLPTVEGAPLEALVQATGPTESRGYGFTYSDIVQRLVPAAVLQAFESRQQFGPTHLAVAASRISATPPFTRSSS